jgi:hypothetical protein
MITVTDIPEDELLLARLAGTKLGKLLGGMLTAGLSSLQLDPPGAFLTGRDRLIRAVVEVVRHTGVRPGAGSALGLNERTTRLSRHVDDFFNRLRRLIEWRGMTREELQSEGGHLTDAYSASLTELQELLRDLHSPVDYRQQRATGQALVAGVVTDLSERS